MNTAKRILGIVAAFFCATVHAGLRCDGDIADIGDAKASVIMKCGPPIFTESFCKPLNQMILTQTPEGVTIIPGCQLVDEWTYNPGSGQFITIMRFEAGVMTSIRYGDRIP